MAHRARFALLHPHALLPDRDIDAGRRSGPVIWSVCAAILALGTNRRLQRSDPDRVLADRLLHVPLCDRVGMPAGTGDVQRPGLPVAPNAHCGDRWPHRENLSGADAAIHAGDYQSTQSTLFPAMDSGRRLIIARNAAV